MRPDPAVAPRLPAYRALAVTVATLALGVFLVALLREFGWSRSVLARAFSVFTLVSGARQRAGGVAGRAHLRRDGQLRAGVLDRGRGGGGRAVGVGQPHAVAGRRLGTLA